MSPRCRFDNRSANGNGSCSGPQQKQSVESRISAKTIKFLGDRRLFRRAFIADLTDVLAEYSWTLSELDSGGYAAIRTKALEAAKPVTAKKLLTSDERSKMRLGKEIWTEFESEISSEREQPDEEEEG